MVLNSHTSKHIIKLETLYSVTLYFIDGFKCFPCRLGKLPSKHMRGKCWYFENLRCLFHFLIKVEFLLPIQQERNTNITLKMINNNIHIFFFIWGWFSFWIKTKRKNNLFHIRGFSPLAEVFAKGCEWWHEIRYPFHCTIFAQKHFPFQIHSAKQNSV